MTRPDPHEAFLADSDRALPASQDRATLTSPQAVSPLARGVSHSAAKPDPLAAYEEAASAYGRGMSDFERGLISPHERGQLSRRLKRAESDLRAARYAGASS